MYIYIINNITYKTDVKIHILYTKAQDFLLLISNKRATYNCTVVYKISAIITQFNHSLSYKMILIKYYNQSSE